jgi:hypothetical protein
MWLDRPDAGDAAISADGIVECWLRDADAHPTANANSPVSASEVKRMRDRVEQFVLMVPPP